MKIQPTLKTAACAGAVSGAVLSFLEHLPIPAPLTVALSVTVFLGSVLVFAIGQDNLHARSVWSIDQLTAGERTAIMHRLPLWFLCMAAALLLVSLVLTL
ncbi:MAG: hypothetical protein ACMG6H_04395 [Acidobacteriota bacterium]